MDDEIIKAIKTIVVKSLKPSKPEDIPAVVASVMSELDNDLMVDVFETSQEKKEFALKIIDEILEDMSLPSREDILKLVHGLIDTFVHIAKGLYAIDKLHKTAGCVKKHFRHKKEIKKRYRTAIGRYL